jgi:uncharacterized protein (TIGR02117 family)
MAVCSLVKIVPMTLLALALLGGMGCSGKPYVIEPESGADDVRSHPIVIVNHGWHAGLIVPASEINQLVPELSKRFGDALYYELGWGDKGFYQSEEITTGLTLQAMFWSEGAVMHVVAVRQTPSAYFAGEEMHDTCLSNAEWLSFKQFIANSFERNASGHAVSMKPGIYGDSQFYAAEGRYYLLNTCNKWTAKALRSAGMDVTPTFKLTSGSVMNYMKDHRRGCTPIPQ